jgi:predicted small metal-binding protein
LTGVDDQELFQRGREHADVHHADDQIPDDFIRDHIAANASDAAAL